MIDTKGYHMAETAKHKPITWEWLRGWLPLILSLVILASSLIALGPRLEAVEAEQAIQKVKIEELVEMRVQLAEMGRDIEWIRERLDRAP